MEIISETLGLSIEVEECEDGINLIRHETLEKILFENQDKIKIECHLKCCNPSMVVVECVSTLIPTGEQFFKVGEANPENLENEISRKFPATMAYNRAIDRAVIAALKLPRKKIYSSEEIQKAKRLETPKESNEIMASDVPPFELPFAEETKVSKDNKKEAPTAGVDAENSLIPVPTSDPGKNTDSVLDLAGEDQQSNQETNNTSNDNGNASQHDEFLSYDEVILFGKFRGMKYGDVKDDKQFKAFINWVDVHGPKLDSPEENRQAEIFKKMNHKIKGVA